MSKISQVTGSRRVSRKGFIIYEIAVTHPELGLKEIIRGELPLVIRRKAEAKAAQWDHLWEKRRHESARRTAPERTAKESLSPAESRRLNLGTSR